MKNRIKEEIDSDLEALKDQMDKPKKIIYKQDQMKEAITNLKKYLSDKILKKEPKRKQLLFQDYIDISNLTLILQNANQLQKKKLISLILILMMISSVKYNSIILPQTMLIRHQQNLNRFSIIIMLLKQKEKIMIQRPDDYLCEMFKSDKIMTKVRGKLVNKQVKIQNFEEKKQRLLNKKFAKQLKSQQEEDQVDYKKKNLQAIEKWKQDVRTKGDKAGNLSQVLLPLEKKRQKQGIQERIQRIEQNKSKFRGGKHVRPESKKIQKGKKNKRPGKVARSNFKKKFNSRKRK